MGDTRGIDKAGGESETWGLKVGDTEQSDMKGLRNK